MLIYYLNVINRESGQRRFKWADGIDDPNLSSARLGTEAPV